LEKFIKNDGSPLPPISNDMPEGEGGGPAVVEVKTEKINERIKLNTYRILDRLIDRRMR
jgi:hypothetical protein